MSRILRKIVYAGLFLFTSNMLSASAVISSAQAIYLNQQKITQRTVTLAKNTAHVSKCTTTVLIKNKKTVKTQMKLKADSSSDLDEVRFFSRLSTHKAMFSPIRNIGNYSQLLSANKKIQLLQKTVKAKNGHDFFVSVMDRVGEPSSLAPLYFNGFSDFNVIYSSNAKQTMSIDYKRSVLSLNRNNDFTVKVNCVSTLKEFNSLALCKYSVSDKRTLLEAQFVANANAEAGRGFSNGTALSKVGFKVFRSFNRLSLPSSIIIKNILFCAEKRYSFI